VEKERCAEIQKVKKWPHCGTRMRRIQSLIFIPFFRL
jgi:hypothetical protein